ncbi:maestro heat-like repeat-containing protein family member 1 [Pseudopipra pipra]|uniref:maestro heat-like repeat-containing protein family member 1 n=1 Tax=Pseudopipra pipra TaxID=415032 RepID=UPI00313A4609
MAARPQSVPGRAGVKKEEEGPGVTPSLPSLGQEPSNPDSSMAEGQSNVTGPASPVNEEEEGPGSAPEWPPQKMEEFQPLRADPVAVLTEEQELIRKRFSSRIQTFWKFVKTTEREEMAITAIEGMANSDSYNPEACAAMLNSLVQSDIPNLKRVPTIVAYIYRWLKTNTDLSAEHRLDKSLLKLAQAHPSDVVVTLLCCAPSCDRAAVSMWKVMVSSSRTAEVVLSELPCVLEDWPLHSACTSEGESKEVFALAATRALWEIIRVPLSPQASFVVPCLFVALLVQVFCSTEQMPSKINFFWRRCRQRHHHPANPNRFAVLTVKALLCRLQLEDVVLAVERKKGWDTLLSTDTHRYAVGLLAREMHRVSRPMREGIARYLLTLFTREESHWRVPAMAFLVEILNCLETEKLVDTILQLMTSHLQSDCKEMRHLVLRGLLMLCKNPLKAKRLQGLTKSLMELLKDVDGELVELTLPVLSKVLLDRDVRIATPIALQLGEALLPLFDNDASRVRLLSIHLFGDMIVYVEKEGKRHLKTCVHQSLLPLFYHLHDENQCVAEASLETLLRATKFLKKRRFMQLLEREQPWRFSECLLSESRRTTDEYRRQSLTYLESSQESMRETAIRFIGLAGQHVRGQQEEFQNICDALVGMTNDISPSISTLADQTLHILRTAPRHRLPFRFQLLQDKLRRIWRR